MDTSGYGTESRNPVLTKSTTNTRPPKNSKPWVMKRTATLPEMRRRLGVVSSGVVVDHRVTRIKAMPEPRACASRSFFPRLRQHFQLDRDDLEGASTTAKNWTCNHWSKGSTASWRISRQLFGLLRVQAPPPKPATPTHTTLPMSFFLAAITVRKEENRVRLPSWWHLSHM